ncbi:Response regulator receiver domain-containing protein [Epilithonimonas bovis DSM 19482]|jgi:CheY-like chemotaxis protein|uniref:Response regulator receiver domain-containing protein n=1 Tax=Epilithonimonas bovis DSM 19482 TaxID=1121284 RepID=A0A1U7PUN3_9FLAO|nr:response regulator [Epilithonimonas bovis]QIY82222.1 response regulator [Chryseobacterium sp. NEB161]SIT97266.1 Response regulator receiver domain-containing protein [Epilithonimonas bovis DSM 19482]
MNNNKILIVDDDPRNIFALKLTLKARGYQSETANSAEEAISILKKDGNIAVVLMDMMMPDTDGYKAISIIRGDQQISHIPVIAVTAQAMQEDRQKCLDAGANDYIKKPIDVDQLIKAIKNLD